VLGRDTRATGCHTLGTNQLVLDGPLDSFYMRVKVAFIVGLFCPRPIWLYQLWAFVAPGLYAREKRWSYIFLGSPSRCSHRCHPGLLVAGPVHALPARPDAGRCLEPDQVDQYLSFVMTMLLAFGLAFELPLSSSC
jgi:sec-independent protein translocase protein TatC